MIPETGNIEEIVFKGLSEKGGMFSYTLAPDEQWMSVNTQKDLEEANLYLTELLHEPEQAHP
jgi:hypothetical protein